MGDSEKPFACTSPGCNMSFTNEDHLVVHKKKHDMILNLGNSGKNTFVADQTPTPTRFIRNCEEVGLFQDLQNVNPFEETFRRAVEDGKTLSESEGGGTDDTLHTPHIFPNIAEASAATIDVAVSKNSKEADSVSTQDENRCINERVIPSESKIPEIIVESKKPIESSRIVVQEADTSIAPKIIETTRSSTNLSINGQEVQLLLKTSDGKLMQLSAVPICENRNESCRIDGIEARKILAKGDETFHGVKKISSNSGGSGRLAHAKMRLKQALTKNGTMSSSAPSKDSSLDVEKSRSNEKKSVNSEQYKKQDVLARNRASSMRARAKRKAWIQQLQKTASNANERNAALQLEVKALRSEVAKLRSLLLAHENCPVTRGMEKGSPVGIESKSSSIVQTMIQNIHTSQSNVPTHRKRIVNSCVTSVPPKTSRSNNYPVILPKINTIKQDIVVNNSSTLKIVDVRTIAIDDETRKKFLASKIHRKEWNS